MKKTTDEERAAKRTVLEAELVDLQRRYEVVKADNE